VLGAAVGSVLLVVIGAATISQLISPGPATSTTADTSTAAGNGLPAAAAVPPTSPVPAASPTTKATSPVEAPPTDTFGNALAAAAPAGASTVTTVHRPSSPVARVAPVASTATSPAGSFTFDVASGVAARSVIPRLSATLDPRHVVQAARVDFGDGTTADLVVPTRTCTRPPANPQVLAAPHHAYARSGSYTITMVVTTAPCNADNTLGPPDTTTVRLVVTT
jgi:hypothetical protein